MSTPPVEIPARRPTLDERLAALPLRERKKLRTSRTIQDHALRLFAEQGYDGTTVEQIAEAAEISPSTFFRYFPTKEDVVITDEYDPIIAEVFRGQPPELSPIDALRATMRDVLTHVYETDLEAIVARTKLMLAVPALRARSFEHLRSGTVAVVIESIAERVGRPVEDPEVQAFGWAVMGMMMSALYNWLDADAKPDLPALIDRNLAFLAAGCPL